MMTLVERAARAMCHGDPDEIIQPAHQASPGCEGPRPLWQTYVPAVRAVLGAIREPSEAVLKAMEETTPADGHEWDFADWRAADHWHSMIDAILEESPKS